MNIDYYIEKLKNDVKPEFLLTSLYKLFDESHIINPSYNEIKIYQINKNIDLDVELDLYINKLKELLNEVKNFDFVLNAKDILYNDLKFTNNMYSKNDRIEFYKYLRLEEFLKNIGVSYSF